MSVRVSTVLHTGRESRSHRARPRGTWGADHMAVRGPAGESRGPAGAGPPVCALGGQARGPLLVFKSTSCPAGLPLSASGFHFPQASHLSPHLSRAPWLSESGRLFPRPPPLEARLGPELREAASFSGSSGLRLDQWLSFGEWTVLLQSHSDPSCRHRQGSRVTVRAQCRRDVGTGGPGPGCAAPDHCGGDQPVWLYRAVQPSA